MSLRDDYKALRDNPAFRHLMDSAGAETAREMHALDYNDPARLGYSHVLSIIDRMERRVGSQAAGKDKVTLMHQRLKESAI